jgi:hypothetical protein
LDQFEGILNVDLALRGFDLKCRADCLKVLGLRLGGINKGGSLGAPGECFET